MRVQKIQTDKIFILNIALILPIYDMSNASTKYENHDTYPHIAL